MQPTLLGSEEARRRLFAHRDLVDLWKASWSLGVDWIQLAMACIVFFAVIAAQLLLPVHASEAIGFARQIASDGLTFATTLLSFLIAGFTVFSTITKPEIFALMARWPEEDELTHLQKVFLLFMQVFAHFCAFCVVCVIAKIFGAQNGVMTALTHSSFPELKLIIASVSGGLMSAWLVYLLLQLSMFIFNMYSMQLVIIDFAMQEQDLENGRKG